MFIMDIIEMLNKNPTKSNKETAETNCFSESMRANAAQMKLYSCHYSTAEFEGALSLLLAWVEPFSILSKLFSESNQIASQFLMQTEGSQLGGTSLHVRKMEAYKVWHDDVAMVIVKGVRNISSRNGSRS